MNKKNATTAIVDDTPFSFTIQRLDYVHPHWHPAIEILLILSGKADIYTADGVSHLESDDILLINAGCRHEIRSRSGCSAISFCLSLEQLSLNDEEVKASYFVCDSGKGKNQEKYANLKTLITITICRNLQGDPVTSRENHSFAYSIYNELMQKFAAAPPPESEERRQALERMEPITKYVDMHYRDGLSLKSLADAVHLTPTYLSAIFTKYLGVTFSEYYNGIRLSNAVRDLTLSESSINLIAVQNGYSSSQAFVRAFKSVYNILPSAYRRQHSTKAQSNVSGVDMALVRRYLPQSISAVSGRDDHIQTVASAQWNHTIGTFDNTFSRLVGIGSAKQILMREVQLQLEDIQRHIHFEYIKFHGIFSDEMMVVSRNPDGSLRFSFRMVDMVFDYLFSIGLKPVLQLSFMPNELAEDTGKLIYNGRFNTSQPKHIEEWCMLVKSFIEHLLFRYGHEVVAELPVFVWNNADSMPEMFGMQEEKKFFQLYRDTFRIVKNLVPEIPFGSPPLTFMNAECIGWAEHFFAYLHAEGIMPDFFCCQYYSEVGANPGDLKIDLKTAQPDHLYHGGENRESFSLDAGVPMTSDPGKMNRHLAFVREFLTSVGFGHLPLWITEFNLTFSHRQWLNDTMFAGCFVLKNVLENIDSVAALGYWSASDFIEEQLLEKQIFHGGLGLMTVDGIRKPQFLAYEALHRVQPDILARGDGYLISRSKDIITVLMYNYEHFSDIYAQNKTYNMTESDRYTPFVEQRRHDFHFQIMGIGRHQVAEATEFIVNRSHGSAFDKWVEMGSPGQGISLPLDHYRLDILKAATYPLAHTISLYVTDGQLDYSCTLDPLEIRLTQILLK